MEASEIIKLLLKHKIYLLSCGVLGLAFSLGIYLLPPKYVSSGTLLVTHAVEPSAGKKLDFFSYEGYYAQQTALSYTGTVVAMLDSVDIRYKALSKIGVAKSDENLKKYSKFIKVTKVGPQVVSLKVKTPAADVSRQLWLALTSELISTSETLNSSGDPDLKVVLASSELTTGPEYRPLPTHLIAGAILGLMFGSFLISAKEYLKNES